jgi:putative tryptophan/tyrosine transport system substrate-binding protein
MVGMRRRAFITLLGGAAATWPLAARAQNSGKIVRIGMLTTANPRSASFIQAFEHRLRDLGYIEGQNMVIDFRNAEGQVDRLPDLAADLARLGADVIVTATEPAISCRQESYHCDPHSHGGDKLRSDCAGLR